MNDNPIKIKPEQIIEIIIKWHWLIIIPFCVSMLIGIYLVFTLPRIYESKTVILVQPQRVPTNIVHDIVESDINARISTLSQRILSRTNLENIIKELGLFSGAENGSMFMEGKVKSLQNRIDVSVTRGRERNADSFSIAFRGTNPEKVMEVTSRLATSFIDENLKMRESQVIGTSSFLEDELETMRKRLIENEQKLKDYRERYMGGLPEQLNSNLRILDTLNDQLATVQGELREAKLILAALNEPRVGYDGEGAAVPVGANENPTSLSQLKEQLEAYRNRYTERHPDVVRLKKMIADLEEQAGKVDGEGETGENDSNSSALRLSDGNVRQKRETLTDIKRLETQKEELLAQIEIYKKRVEDTPKREQELQSLQRDYNNIDQTYNSLLGRQLEAQIAVNMEKKQKGEQFRILDPARVAQEPVEPNMKKIFVFIVAAGLGLGGGVIFLLEFLNTSFKEPEEVESFLGLPVLATIPTIFDDNEKRRKRVKMVASILGVMTSISLFGGFVGTIIFKG